MRVYGYYTGSDIPFSALIGKTLVSVTETNGKSEIMFTASDGEQFMLWHEQDCCESVTIEDICGELQDLVGSPILLAEENSSRDWPEGVEKPEYLDSFTWTFYRLATNKGSVVIRWYGSSNGYYSESVSFTRLVVKS